jgi:hypothetical protein
MITISRRVSENVSSRKVFDNIDILQYYTKTSRNSKKGLFVAQVHYKDRKVSIGWSLCNTSHGDTFDKLRGISIAIGRMSENTSKLDKDFIKDLFKKVPHSMHDELKYVLGRLERMLDASKKKNKKKHENKLQTA